MPRILLLLVTLAMLVATGSRVAHGEPPSGPPDPSPTGSEPGQPGGTASPSAEPSPPAAEPAPESPLLVRARRIRALIDGTLDVAIEPSSLFVIDLNDPKVVGEGGDRLRRLLLELDRPPPEPAPPEPEGRRRRRAPAPEPPPPVETEPPPREPAEELADAFAAYLSLDAEQREAVLATHAKRRAAAAAEREAASRRETRLTELTRRADRLEAFLAGTLDVELDPVGLLTMDLGDANGVALSPARRHAWTSAEGDRGASEPGATEPGVSPEPASPTSPSEPPPAGAEPPSPSPEPSASPDPLVQAEARLDGLRRQFLALPLAERDKRFEIHERRRQQAKEASAAAEAEAKAEAQAQEEAAAREAALGQETVQQISEAEAQAQVAAAKQKKAEEEARRARTETERILKLELARLSGIQEAQAQYAIDINTRKTERNVNHDRALEQIEQVRKLVDGDPFDPERASRADALYDEIRGQLTDTRRRLAEELDRVRAAGSNVPQVGDTLDRGLAGDIDRGEIEPLRELLAENAEQLTRLEADTAWELAQGLLHDVNALNDSRLRLLEIASPSLRSDVTGFGPRGVDQVSRELDQIKVELGFHLLKLPRYGGILLDAMRDAPLSVAMGLVQLLLVGLAWLWWRRRSPDLLARMRRSAARHRPVPRWASAVLALLWYFERIRRPLELLLVLWVLFSLAGPLDDMPELMLLWIVLRWVLIGLAVILTVDAIAARDHRYSPKKGTDTSALRIHSLRVVGLTVIAVGLLLGLTTELVGKGAIHRWVLSTCWLLIVPVVLYLVHRWRPTIRERLQSLPQDNAFVTWALGGKERTDVGFLAAILAAAYLMVRGLSLWVMRHASGLEATRRVLAYLFRREVARRAATVSASEKLDRVDSACYGIFDPDHLDPSCVDEAAQRELELIAGQVDAHRSTLSAVVGERGMGKSTFLRRLQDRLGTERLKVVPCPEVGLDGLIPRIASLTGDPSLRGPELTDALRRMGPVVIAIDDAQRLMQPAIRGLRELDRLTAFARDVGGEVSWVITMGAAAWHYLQRARGDRVFFEQVVVLPRWTEEQLGALIRKRCEHAGITPSYEGLVVPRSPDPGAEPEDQRTETSYYRLLWDYSRGNPAVALQAFRESLFLRNQDQREVVVRMFKEPLPVEIESLSLTLLFVLRAIVQLDVAREHELVDATLLPASDVSDALRFCRARGYIEPSDNGVRLTWHWFRTITTVLQRQHLLSLS